MTIITQYSVGIGIQMELLERHSGKLLERHSGKAVELTHSFFYLVLPHFESSPNLLFNKQRLTHFNLLLDESPKIPLFSGVEWKWGF